MYSPKKILQYQMAKFNNVKPQLRLHGPNSLFHCESPIDFKLLESRGIRYHSLLSAQPYPNVGSIQVTQ